MVIFHSYVNVYWRVYYTQYVSHLFQIQHLQTQTALKPQVQAFHSRLGHRNIGPILNVGHPPI